VPRAIPITTFAKDFSISRRTVYNLINDGKLRTIKIANRRLVPIDECERVQKEGTK